MIGVLDIATDALLATIVGGVISAGVSIIVAGIFGERAATKFSIKYGTKKEHDRSLVGAPTAEVIKEVEGFERAMSVGVNWLKDGELLFTLLPNLEKGQKRETTEKDLLITHLETGYSEVFNQLKEFRDQYNASSKTIASISYEMWTWIREPTILPPYSIKKSMQTEWCNYEQTISTFVSEAFGEWQREREISRHPLVRSQVEGSSTYYFVEWQTQLAHTLDNPTATKMRDRIDELVGSKFHDALIALYNENLSLKEKGAKIKEALEIIRVKVTAGVPLRGRCSAGQEADPKFE